MFSLFVSSLGFFFLFSLCLLFLCLLCLCLFFLFLFLCNCRFIFFVSIFFATRFPWVKTALVVIVNRPDA